MSEAKWTQGPWKVYDRGIGFEVHTSDDETVNQGFRETFTEEDARLIAAAPELYEALERLKVLASEHSFPKYTARLDEAINMADIALAHARGEK